MNFKRIISLILVISVVFTTFCVFANENSVSLDNDTTSIAIHILENLKIIYKQNDSAYNSEIARADFVLYAARALGIDDKLTDKSTRYFVDIAQYDYAAYSINMLVDMGIISVNEERTFRPGDSITLDEALKIVLCMTGYQPVANARGGFPVGYYSVARSLKLTQGLSKNGVFTFNDAAVLLYRTLNIPMYTVKSIKTDGEDFLYNYDQSQKHTILYVVFGFFQIEGILTGVNEMNIAFDVLADKNEVVIENKKFKNLSNIDMDDCLGYNVGALYNEDNEISYFYIKSSKNDITEFDICDYVSFDGLNITYNNGGRRNETIDVRSAVVLYNGSVPPDRVKELFDNLECGSIRIVDYNNDNINDAVIVNDYHAFVYKSIDKRNNVVYGKIEGQNLLKLNEYDNVIIKDSNGNPADESVFKENCVLNIEESVDKSRIRITVTDNKVSGNINSIKYDYTRVLIDDVEYTLNKKHSKILKNVKAGTNVTVLTNIQNQIVYLEENSSLGYNVGFLCGLSVDLSKFNNEAKLRIYSKEFGLVTYLTKNSVKIDGIKYKDAKKIVEAIPDCFANDSTVNCKSQIVLYKLDNENKIYEIDTCYVSPMENPGSTLCRTTQGAESLAKYTGRFGRKNPIDAATSVFCVPSDEEISSSCEDDYAVVTQNQFRTNVNLGSIECYKIKGDDEICSIVVYRTNLSDYEVNDWLNSYMFVVGELSEAIDDEGEIYKQISGMYLGREATLDVYENKLTPKSMKPATLNEGDLIRYRSGKDGTIIELQKLYDAENNVRLSWNGDNETESLFDSSFSNSFQLSYGYVNNRGSKVVAWGYKSGDNVDEVLDMTSVPIMFYDKNQKMGSRLYIGEIDSITDYQTEPDKCDIVIVQTVLGALNSVVVYKR